jgi:multidrug efflux pump subunit AcrA (membrane-fusion protein)
VRRTTAIAVVILLAGGVGAAGWAVTGGWSLQALPPSLSSVPAGASPIVRTHVAERVTLSGTLGYVGAYQVIAPSAGTLTRLSALGQVVRRGQPIYGTDGPLRTRFGGCSQP